MPEVPAFRYVLSFSQGPAEISAHLENLFFTAGQFVDVIGTSKGHVLTGVVKRYKFGGLRMTHGSMMHRRTGAIGCRSTPGRVWKNQKMPGHDGDAQRTVQNLKVVAVRAEDGALLISGAIPGAKGSYVTVRPAKKKKSA
jgi:large subunit ribosomal protein L3